MLEKCKIASIQPENNTFNEYMKKMILLTRKNENEYGFGYQILKYKKKIARTPNTPLFEGKCGHVAIEQDLGKKFGSVHTHPLTSTNFGCDFSGTDVNSAKILGETMLTCVFTRDKDKRIEIYTMDKEDLTENPNRMPSVHTERELILELSK